MKKLTFTIQFVIYFTLVVCFILFFSPSLAQAQGANPTADSSSNQNQAGKTIVARGDVKAKDASATRFLKRRAPVYKVDTVSTGSASRTQMRMVDGGLLALKQESELAIADYEFNAVTGQGNVSMSLIKGGLRTVTGSLINATSNYELVTPVASIGVRGTHYTAQMDGADLLLAVWDGEIVIQVSVGVNPLLFSLGPNLKYSAARVKSNGEVEFLLQLPALIGGGHTSENTALVSSMQSLAIADPILLTKPQTQDVADVTGLALAANTHDLMGAEWYDNGVQWNQLSPSLVSASSDGISRSGSATFGLIAQSFTSSVGDVSNASMSMTVDFNLARIPTGNLSFTDAGGQWFAAFNGVLNSSGLDLSINFASHGNNLANGNLSALFNADQSQVLGQLTLFETGNTSVSASGGYLLGDSSGESNP